MKTFKHANKYWAKLVRPEAANDVTFRKYKGITYEVMKVEGCVGKLEPSIYSKCEAGGDDRCPGKVLLDKYPFNGYSSCWCFNTRSIFDFYMD